MHKSRGTNQPAYAGCSPVNGATGAYAAIDRGGGSACRRGDSPCEALRSSPRRPLKIKRLPEDFQVEELTAFPSAGGSYALYRLQKRSIGTPEAIDEVVRRWKIPRHRISYGGLKDKHAVTRQFVTVQAGPRRDFARKNFQ